MIWVMSVEESWQCRYLKNLGMWERKRESRWKRTPRYFSLRRYKEGLLEEHPEPKFLEKRQDHWSHLPKTFWGTVNYKKSIQKLMYHNGQTVYVAFDGFDNPGDSQRTCRDHKGGTGKRKSGNPSTKARNLKCPIHRKRNLGTHQGQSASPKWVHFTHW